MIELYSGTPGSGKSLHAAREIRERLRSRKKRVVLGNFFIDRPACGKGKGVYLYVSNHRLTPGRLLSFARRYAQHLGRRLKEGELLLVIDEAQLLFNAREWQNLARAGWLSFFSQHRHYGYDIILVTQFDRMLDRQVRGLIEYDTVHRKVARAGTIGAVLGFLTGGSMFVCVKQWYPIHEKVESHFFLGRKNLYAVYDSYNHLEAPGEKQPAAGRKHPSASGKRRLLPRLPAAGEKTAPAETASPVAAPEPSPLPEESAQPPHRRRHP